MGSEPSGWIGLISELREKEKGESESKIECMVPFSGHQTLVWACKAITSIVSISPWVTLCCSVSPNLSKEIYHHFRHYTAKKHSVAPLPHA